MRPAGRLATLALFVALSTSATRSRADGSAPLIHVGTTTGAAGCPNDDEFTRLLEGILGSRLVAEPSLSVSVVFERQEVEYHATIRITGGRFDGGPRTLRDTSRDCDAIARAAAVTIAILFDDVPEPEAAARPARGEPASPPPPFHRASSASREVSREHARWAATAGPGVLAGALPSPTAGGFVELAWRPSQGLSVPLTIWGFAGRFAYATGSVDIALVLPALAACVETSVGRAELVLCAGAGAGVLSGHGHGFAIDRDARHVVATGTAAATVRGGIAGSLEWSVRMAALAPAASDGFFVEGAGTAARLPRLSVAGAVGLGMTIP